MPDVSVGVKQGLFDITGKDTFTKVRFVREHATR